MATSVANVVSHFPEAENGFTTTLASTIASGATTVPLNSVAGYTNGQPAVFVVDPSDPAKKQTFTGNIDTSGIQVTSVVWTAGTNQTHTGGATVVDYATATHISMMSKGLLVEHTQAGRHSMTSPKVTTGINDSNNNELLKVTATTSAVNELTLANAATGNAPTLSATGDDTNIDLNLTPKGTGEVTKAGNPIDWWEEIGRTTLTVAGDTISVTGIPARKWLMILVSTIDTGGTLIQLLRFNNDSGNNYAHRISDEGSSDATSASRSSISAGTAGGAWPQYTVMHVTNIATQEKLVTSHATGRNAAGAASIPRREEIVGKWANTSDQVSRVDIVNAGTGDFAIGSEVVVLGHD